MPIALSPKKRSKKVVSHSTHIRERKIFLNPQPIIQWLTRLEHKRGGKASHKEGDTTTSRDASGTVGGGGTTGARRGRSSGRDRGATAGGGRVAGGRCEGSDDTETGLFSVGDAGGEGSKGLGASGGWVDGTVHAALAMRLPGAEEPDGVCGLGHLEGEDADLARGSVVRHEWRSEAILVGDGVELLGARGSKGALGDGVVTSVELEVY